MFPYTLPLFGDDSAASSGIDHLSLALARYAKFLRDEANNVLPVVTSYTTAIVTTQHQELEQALQDLLFYRQLANAYGQHLDNIGEIVGQPRSGLDDNTYRLYIQAKIAVNLSSGTVEDVLSVFELVLPGVLVTLKNYYPAAFILYVDGQITAVQATAFAQFVLQAKSGGVRGVFEWTQSTPANTFTFDIGPGLDQGALAGAAN